MGAVSAQDSDGDPLSYSIIATHGPYGEWTQTAGRYSPYPAPFAIDSVNGELRITINHEHASQWLVEVEDSTLPGVMTVMGVDVADTGPEPIIVPGGAGYQ